MAEEEYVESWSDLTMPELREELKARGLDTSGKKDDLVARLEEDDARRDAETETADVPPEASENAGETLEEPDPAETVEPDVKEASLAEEPRETPGHVVVEVAMPEDVDNAFELEDSDLDRMRAEARQWAVDAGMSPYGSAYSARFLGASDGVARFEVPLR